MFWNLVGFYKILERGKSTNYIFENIFEPNNTPNCGRIEILRDCCNPFWGWIFRFTQISWFEVILGLFRGHLDFMLRSTWGQVLRSLWGCFDFTWGHVEVSYISFNSWAPRSKFEHLSLAKYQGKSVLLI